MCPKSYSVIPRDFIKLVTLLAALAVVGCGGGGNGGGGGGGDISRDLFRRILLGDLRSFSRRFFDSLAEPRRSTFETTRKGARKRSSSGAYLNIVSQALRAW